MSIRILSSIAAASTIAFASQAHAVTLFSETFDIDAADTTAFESAYSAFTVNAGAIYPVSASAGQAFITGTGTNNTTSATVAGIGGDVTYSLDVGASLSNGNYNVGIAIGTNRIVFHPGFGAGGALRVEGPGGFGNTNMGFVPANGTLHNLTITQTAATGVFDITLTDGDNAANVFNTSFTNLASVGGDFGITRGGPSAGQTGIFDNLLVTGIPEPSTGLLFSLAAIGLVARRRR